LTSVQLKSLKIICSKSALNDVKKLDTVVKNKIGKSILRYSADPLHYAQTVNSTELGTYRWRAGNYRIIFDISSKRIEVLRIGHRMEIYKK